MTDCVSKYNIARTIYANVSRFAMFCYISILLTSLTHWDRDKMAAIPYTTVSNVFSWRKMYEFRLQFH